MLKSKLTAKYQCIYKVRDKNTGLFSTGSHHPRWKKSGKVWHRIGDLKNHLNQFKHMPDNWEVCEFPISIPLAYPATNYFTPPQVRPDGSIMGYRYTPPSV